MRSRGGIDGEIERSQNCLEENQSKTALKGFRKENKVMDNNTGLFYILTRFNVVSQCTCKHTQYTVWVCPAGTVMTHTIVSPTGLEKHTHMSGKPIDG